MKDENKCTKEGLTTCLKILLNMGMIKIAPDKDTLAELNLQREQIRNSKQPKGEMKEIDEMVEKIVETIDKLKQSEVLALYEFDYKVARMQTLDKAKAEIRTLLQSHRPSVTREEIIDAMYADGADGVIQLFKGIPVEEK